MSRNNIKQHTLNLLLIQILQLVLFSGLAYAQRPIGNLSGIITDPTGSIMSDAVITVTSLSTGIVRTLTSNKQGYFLVTNLQADAYIVRVTANGFNAYEVDRLTIEVGQTPNLEITMKVGGTNETVSINGSETSLVDTVNTNVGGVVSVRQIQQLPLNGRNYLELAKLQPGVESIDGGTIDSTKSRYSAVSIASQPGREARITIDGIDAVDEVVGSTNLNISQDSIQEFQVSTSTSDISTGLSATGAINVITRRGSNQFHGGLFGFLRGSGIAARPTFAGSAPSFWREQFGANGGGAIIKDKLFGFANFERTQENSVLGISTPLFPNLTSYKSPYYLNSYTGRTDYHLSDKHDFLFRMSVDDNSNFGRFGGITLPSFGTFNKNRAYQYVGGVDSVLSGNLANSFRAGLTSFKNRLTGADPNAQKVALTGLENYTIVIPGLLISGPNANPQSTGQVFGQFRDEMTYFTDNHTFKFGGDAIRYRFRPTSLGASTPLVAITPPNPANPNILNQRVLFFTIGNRKGNSLAGEDDNSHRNTRFSIFAEDSWRIKSNITINYGARYKVDTNPLNNDFNKPAIVKPLLPNGTAPTPVDYKNISPHFGIAYAPWKNNKTVFRAGFGLYYSTMLSDNLLNEHSSLIGYNLGPNGIILRTGLQGIPGAYNIDFIGNGNAFNFTSVFTTNNLQSALQTISAGQDIFAAAPASNQTALDFLRTGTVTSNKLQTPYSEQFNIGVQRELPLNSVLDVNLIYFHSLHQFQVDSDASHIFPGNGTPVLLGDGMLATNPISVVNSDGISRYRALTLRYDKRFGNRFQMTAAYAFSRLETTSEDGFGLGAQNQLFNNNNAANIGIAPADRRHRFTMNGIVDLPRGFRLSTISTIYSAVPTTARIGTSDIYNNGISGSLLPGTRRGSLGRRITSTNQLNALIRAYNLSALNNANSNPYVFEVPDNYSLGDSLISQDFQLSYTKKMTERFKVEVNAQLFNAFNISNVVGPGGFLSSPLNGTLTTIRAVSLGTMNIDSNGSIVDALGNKVVNGSDGATRPSVVTGSGLPRAAQFGLRLIF